MPNDISREFVESLPKTDLHLHLDGSLRLGTLIDLAQEQGLELPSLTEEGLNELVFPDAYEDLTDYLKGFSYTVAVLQRAEALERVAYELAVDNIAERVCYIEVRFAPQLHVHEGLDMAGILGAVNAGLARAKKEYNASEPVKLGWVPPFEYGIIVSAMRYFEAGFSPYFRALVTAHPYSTQREISGFGSLELARAATAIRDEHGLPVVGIDLAGAERGHPAHDHELAFQHAHESFLKKTVHAGEDYGPESIFEAITDLHADRIGHGTFLFETQAVSDAVGDKEAYVKELAEYIADRRVTIEVCLTSNSQTIPELASVPVHPFRKMREAHLSCTLCTDNRLVSHTTVTDELMKAVGAFDLNPRELRNLIIYGFKRSFFPGRYREKRRYVRQVIDQYEALERREFLSQRM